MTIDDKISDEKLQYDLNIETTKTSALQSGKINKYEHLTWEEIIPSDAKRMIERATFKYFSLEKALEK